METEYKIVPYVEINGKRTLSDGIIKNIWEQMKQENIVRRMFYTGAISDEVDFIRWMKSPKNIVHTVWEHGDIAALALLNGYNGYSALGHYCIFKNYLRDKADAIAKQTIAYWFAGKKSDGSRAVSLIVGFTPDNNRLAVKMLVRMGFVVVGTLPEFTYDVYKKRRVGLTISYRRPDDGNRSDINNIRV